MPAGIGSMTSPAKTRTTRGMSTAASASRLGLPLVAEGGPTTAVQGRDEADGVSGDEADPTEVEDHGGEDAPAVAAEYASWTTEGTWRPALANKRGPSFVFMACPLASKQEL